MIFVVETKGDEEIKEPSPENAKKYEYAIAHFQRLNKWLEKEGLPIRYQFNFLSPKNYNAFPLAVVESVLAAPAQKVPEHGDVVR